jgi:hypothetical protein
MKVIVHGMGGVINEVWAYTPENITKLSIDFYPEHDSFYPGYDKNHKTDRQQLVNDLLIKEIHSYKYSEPGYSELVVMEVIE